MEALGGDRTGKEEELERQKVFYRNAGKIMSAFDESCALLSDGVEGGSSAVELLREVHEAGKLPVVNFAAGGIATPADAALMMQLGAEGVFVGSGIFKSGNPAERARAIVGAVTRYEDPEYIAHVSENLGEAMVGINKDEIELLMAERGI